MIVGGESAIIDYRAPFDQGLFNWDINILPMKFLRMSLAIKQRTSPVGNIELLERMNRGDSDADGK